MQICAFKIFRYRLPLTRPVPVKGQTLTAREGLILQITDDAGASGFGEVAPLPGVSLETVDQALAQVCRLRQGMAGTSVPEDFGAVEQRMKRIEDIVHPSVRCGVEAAFWSLWAAQRGVVPAQVLGEAPAVEHVAVNALLEGGAEEIGGRAKDVVRAGFRTLKMKAVGPLEDDIARAQAVVQAAGHEAILRVDANQRWSLEEAVRFAEAVGMESLEYLEEPFKDVQQIPEFYARTLIPVAVDESLRRHDLKDLKILDGMEIVVLKPSLLGLKKTIELADAARGYGLRPVISSSFESTLGILLLAQLAAALSRGVAAGLDTLKFYQDDLLRPAPVIERGTLASGFFPRLDGQLCFDHLTECP